MNHLLLPESPTYTLAGNPYRLVFKQNRLLLKAVQVGATKTHQGVTYRLNRNKRWERVGSESPGQLPLIFEEPTTEEKATMATPVLVGAKNVLDASDIRDDDKREAVNRVFSDGPAAYLGHSVVTLGPRFGGTDEFGMYPIVKRARWGDAAVQAVDYNSGGVVFGPEARIKMVELAENNLRGSNIVLNEQALALVTPLRANLDSIPAISANEFEAKWQSIQAAEADGQTFENFYGDRESFQGWRPSDFASFYFTDASGVAANVYGSGWSMSALTPIFSMPRAQVKEYFRDLAGQRDIPAGVRQTWLELSNAVGV